MKKKPVVESGAVVPGRRARAEKKSTPAGGTPAGGSARHHPLAVLSKAANRGVSLSTDAANGRLSASIESQRELEELYTAALDEELAAIDRLGLDGPWRELALHQAPAKAWLRVRFATHPLVKKGLAFKPGRSPGASGRMKKLVREMVAQLGKDTSARDLWKACQALPKKKRMGIDFGAPDDGAWYPQGGGHCSFQRFSNILSEVRKSV